MYGCPGASILGREVSTILAANNLARRSSSTSWIRATASGSCPSTKSASSRSSRGAAGLGTALGAAAAGVGTMLSALDSGQPYNGPVAFTPTTAPRTTTATGRGAYDATAQTRGVAQGTAAKGEDQPWQLCEFKELLASELGIELALVRVDALISSFLGETAANMRKVFDFIDAGRFVVLFDEFDAVGKEREDPSEHGELKRVVNSFLQMVDTYRGQSVIVAATNHETLLDRALWRRFDEVLYLDRPTREQVRKLLETKLRGVRSDLPLDEPGLLDRFASMSHADIERCVDSRH